MGLCDKPDEQPVLDPHAIPPTVSLMPLTNITHNSVTLNGTVDPNLATTSWHFEYGLTSEYGRYAPGLDGIVPADSSAQVSVNLTGLDPTKTYHYRLHASNGKGIANTNDGTFTTAGQPGTTSAPAVSENAASAVTSSTATLTGSVTPNGAPSGWHFEVSRTISDGAVYDHSFQDTDTGVTNDHVEYVGTGWVHCGGCSPSTPDDSFYYNVTAGDILRLRFNGTRLVVFAPAEPVGATAANVTVDGVAAGSASFYASIQSNGIRYDTGVISSGNHVVEITVPAGGNTVLFDHAEVYIGGGPSTVTFKQPVPDGLVTGGGTPVPVSINLTGLEASTVYTYSLHADNIIGSADTATQTFTTGSPASTAPTVTINTATNVTTNTAQISGTITPNGSATNWHFEWGLDGVSYPNIVPVPDATMLAGPTSNVTATLTGLPSDTTIHYRLKGTNSAGTTYSTDKTVHTNLGIPSGFWPYGGSLDTNEEGSTDSWQNNMGGGRPATICTVYNNRTSFGMFDLGQGQTGVYNNKTHQLVLQTSPFPTDGSASYTALLNGAYDGNWRSYAAQMKAREDAGFAPIIVSLAWEANGTYMEWGGPGARQGFSSNQQYKDAYRRVVQQMRITYPNVLTAWVMNGWGSNPQANAFDIYPGNDVVTYIGMDWYDHFDPGPPGPQTREEFITQANKIDGPLYVLSQIRSASPDALGRPKKLLVPEWGIDVCNNGEKPDFITWMFEEVFKNAYSTGHMAGEAYFNESPGSCFDIYYSRPLARARYQQLYRP